MTAFPRLAGTLVPGHAAAILAGQGRVAQSRPRGAQGRRAGLGAPTLPVPSRPRPPLRAAGLGAPLQKGPGLSRERRFAPLGAAPPAEGSRAGAEVKEEKGTRERRASRGAATVEATVGAVGGGGLGVGLESALSRRVAGSRSDAPGRACPASVVSGAGAGRRPSPPHARERGRARSAHPGVLG